MSEPMCPPTKPTASGLEKLAKSRKGSEIGYQPPRKTSGHHPTEYYRDKIAARAPELHATFNLSAATLAHHHAERWIPVLGEWAGQYQILEESSKGYLCQCVCGKQEVVSPVRLKTVPSCRHEGSRDRGMTRSNKVLYMTWRRILVECFNDPDSNFMCDEWRSYRNFESDVSSLDYTYNYMVRLDDSQPWSIDNVVCVSRWLWKSMSQWAYYEVAHQGHVVKAFPYMLARNVNLDNAVAHYKRYRNLTMLLKWVDLTTKE